MTEMREEVHRIQHVIEEYLQFARLPKPQLRPVELNELLGQKLDFMNGDFRARPRETADSFRSGGGGRSTPTPSNCGRRCLNLIRNSLDAMPDGGELTIGTWREGGQVRLRVTDTGKGMSEEQLQEGVRALLHHQAGRHRLGVGARPANRRPNTAATSNAKACRAKGSTFTIFLPVPKKN